MDLISLLDKLNIVIQGYPQRIRLQRRLYGSTVCFFMLMNPCNCAIVFFLTKSFNMPLKDYRVIDKGWDSKVDFNLFQHEDPKIIERL